MVGKFNYSRKRYYTPSLSSQLSDAHKRNFVLSEDKKRWMQAAADWKALATELLDKYGCQEESCEECPAFRARMEELDG